MVTKTRKPLVRWTAEELDKVVQAAVKASFDDRSQVWRFFAEGQKHAVPANRQRNVNGEGSISGELVDMFIAAREEILTQGIPYPVEIEKEVVVEPSREELLASVTPEEIGSLLAKRLAPLLDLMPLAIRKFVEMPSPMATVVRSAESVVRQASPPAARAEPRRTRVLISGFLPGQEQDIKEKAKSLDLELVFQRKDSTAEPPPSVQWCVALIKMDHRQSIKLRAGLGSSHVRMVHGISEAMSELNRINSLKP